jgi:hypothetical protein
MPPSRKTSYSIQVVIILAVFFFVLFNLVFKLIIDLRSEAIREKAEQMEKERVKLEFIAHIDEQYRQLLKLYAAKEYEKVIEIIKVFNRYEQSEYENLREIKKEIRLFYLKKKLDFIPKIHLDEYMQLSREIDIEEDDTTEVFIRTPRYGQYFYTSDLPIALEGVALSVAGDFSQGIEWTSSKDGYLGKGKKIFARLSIGEHQIVAVGSNGTTTGRMETRVYIEEDPDFLKEYIRN